MSIVSEQKVLSSQPYQLIYERIDTFKHSVVYDKVNHTLESLLRPFKCKVREYADKQTQIEEDIQVNLLLE